MSQDAIVPTITALSSIVAIVVALYAVYVQNRQSKAILGMTVLRDYIKEFDTPRMRRARFELATFLLNRSHERAEPPTALFDVLDFFDSLAGYFNAAICEPAMAWGRFYYWVGFYGRLRLHDAFAFEKACGGVGYYRDMQRMYLRLNEYGLRSGRMVSEQRYFSDDNIRRFLELEIQACSDVSTRGSE